MPNLEEMNLLNLKKIAKECNIKNISKLKKVELIEVLKQISLPEAYLQEESKTYDESNNSKNENTEKEAIEKQYDENGNRIIDYKLTNEGDEIVEGILDILPDGYGFLRGENFYLLEK